MKVKFTTKYVVKSLIAGVKVTELDDTKTYIAIPDRGYKDAKRIMARFGEDIMYIDNWHKAKIYKRFHDQFREGQFYTLAYFEWLPTEKFIDYENDYTFTKDGRAVLK